MTLPPEDAPRRPAAGGPGDHPARRQRLHRDDEGHRARQLPRGNRRPDGDLPPRTARREGRLPQPRGADRRRAPVLGADDGLPVLPAPARAQAEHGATSAAPPGSPSPEQSARQGASRERADPPRRRARQDVRRPRGAEGHRPRGRAGEVVVVFGRSGSGKSTLLRCVNFLEEPTAGTIEVDGITLVGGGHRTKAKREQIRRLRVSTGMVFQDFNLFPHLTALDNVCEGPRTVLRRSDAEVEDRSAASCSTSSGFQRRRTPTRSSSPAVSSSGSRSRGRSR